MSQHHSTNCSLLSVPRHWPHHEPREPGGSPVPGAVARLDGSRDGFVRALFSHAAWSLWLGVFIIRIVQELQAKEKTKPTGTEPRFFILTSHAGLVSLLYLCQPPDSSGLVFSCWDDSNLEGFWVLIKLEMLYIAPVLWVHSGIRRPLVEMCRYWTGLVVCKPPNWI